MVLCKAERLKHSHTRCVVGGSFDFCVWGRCSVFITGDQFKGKGMVTGLAAIQRLPHFQLHFAGGIILVFKPGQLAQGAAGGILVGGGNRQGTVAVILHIHFHLIGLGVACVAIQSIIRFPQLIQEGPAMVCLGIAQRAKQHARLGFDGFAGAAGGCILRPLHTGGGDHFAIGFAVFVPVHQLKLEFVLLDDRTGERLVRLKLHGTGSRIGVDKGRFHAVAAAHDRTAGILGRAGVAGQLLLGDLIGAFGGQVTDHQVLIRLQGKGITIAHGDLPDQSICAVVHLTGVLIGEGHLGFIAGLFLQQRQGEGELHPFGSTAGTRHLLADAQVAKGLVGVGHLKAVDLRLVLGGIFLFDLVYIFPAAPFVSGQLAEGVFPTIGTVGGNDLGLDLLAVPIQMQGDKQGTRAVDIAVIVPYLMTGQLHGLVFVDVADHIFVVAGKARLRRVARHRLFHKAVEVRCAVLVHNIHLQQHFGPVVAGIQHHLEGLAAEILHRLGIALRACHFAQNRYRYRLRTHAIVVVIILPFLGHLQGGGHDAHTGIVVADHALHAGPLDPVAHGLALQKTHTGIVEGIHVVFRIRGGIPVHLIRIAFHAGIGALGIPHVGIAVIIRGAHAQVGGQMLLGHEDEILAAGGMAGIDGNGGYSHALGHRPHAIDQLGHSPVVPVGDVIVSGGQDLRILLVVVIGGFGLGFSKLQARNGGIQQHRLHTGVDELVKVHPLQRAAPLTLSVPCAGPVLAILHMLVVGSLGGIGAVRTGKDVVFNGIVENDILGGCIRRGTDREAVGIGMALEDRHLLLIGQTLRPVADQIVAHQFFQTGNRIVQRIHGVGRICIDKAVLIRGGIQIRQQVGDLLREGGGGAVVAAGGIIRLAPLPINGAQRIKAQVVHRGLEGGIVDQRIAVFVQIFEGIGCVKLQYRRIVERHVVIVLPGPGSQNGLRHQQVPAAAFVVFDGIDIAGAVAGAQLDGFRLGYHMERQQIVPDTAGLRRDRADLHGLLVLGEGIQIALLLQSDRIVNENLIILRVATIIGFFGQGHAVACARHGGAGGIGPAGHIGAALTILQPAVGIHLHIIFEFGDRVDGLGEQIRHDVLDPLGGLEGDDGVHIPVHSRQIALFAAIAFGRDVAHIAPARIGHIFRKIDGIGGRIPCAASGELAGERIVLMDDGGQMLPLSAVHTDLHLQIGHRKGGIDPIAVLAVGQLAIGCQRRLSDLQGLEIEILGGKLLRLIVEKGHVIFGDLFPTQTAIGILQFLLAGGGLVGAGEFAGPGIAFAFRLHNEGHIHFIAQFQPVEGKVVIPILPRVSFRPFAHNEGSRRDGPLHGAVGQGYTIRHAYLLLRILAVPGSCLAVGLGQHPGHFIIQIIDPLIFVGIRHSKIVLAVGRPHIDRFAVLDITICIHQVFRHLSGKIDVLRRIDGAGVVGAAKENAIRHIGLGAVGILFIGSGQHILDVQ